MQVVIDLVEIFIFPGALYLLVGSMAATWLDRKLVARWQGRVGPPWYQPLADLVKLLAKEDVVTVGANPTVSALLPMVALACTMAASMCVPVGNHVASSFEGDLVVIVFLLSMPSLAYFLAGWAAPSPFGVIGGNRALLQYLSYEVPLLMSLAAPALAARSWNIVEIMVAQEGYHWHLFTMPVGLGVALIGLIGKLKRVPFDIPDAKSEIGAGPLTEYSGRKLALWKLTVSVQTLVGLNLLVAVYLGGADMMWGHWGFAVYVAKVTVLLAGLSLVQVLYARLRIDQLAEIGWRALVPLAMAQMLTTIWF